jgi:hypothetical protein
VRYKWPFVRCSFKGLYSLHFGSSSTSDLTPSSEDQIWWFDWRHGNPDFDAKRAGIRSPIGPATDTGAQKLILIRGLVESQWEYQTNL